MCHLVAVILPPTATTATHNRHAPMADWPSG